MHSMFFVLLGLKWPCDGSALMCQLCDAGHPDGRNALLRLLLVNKVSACTLVAITGATQESDVIYDVIAEFVKL